MANNQALSSEERLRIVEALRKGNYSHREIAKRFNRSQSTISSIARDAGVTPSHRRKRTPAISDVEGTYDRHRRVEFTDRFIGGLEGMITDGGLSPKYAREIAQAAKILLDARRSEDLEPAEEQSRTTTRVPIEGMGEMAVDPNTYVGRELLKLQAEMYPEE